MLRTPSCLDWTYDAVDVPSSSLASFLDGLDDTWRGLSLTMPLKRTVLPMLDEADDVVRRSGVANTVVLGLDGRRGFNTDVGGAEAAIRERTSAPVSRAVVLGGGATAASVLLALAGLGCTTATLLVRDPARAASTLDVVSSSLSVTTALLGSSPGPADIVVSTVPASAQTPSVLAGLDAAVFFDVVYDPWPTPLASLALSSGQVLVSGLDLLVHQAARQVGLMAGVPDVGVLVEPMRLAGQRALAARA